MGRYKKNNITLQIRVPADFAISILGRLYGKGWLTYEQYLSRVANISKEKAEKEKQKSEKLNLLIKKAEKNRFFNKKEVYI